MSSISRRHFLKTGMAYTIGFAGLSTFLGGLAACTPQPRKTGFGPLIADRLGIFDLPDRFSYKIISRSGQLMSDGFYVPGVPDGMATFPGSNSRTIIVRNHEVGINADPSMGPFGAQLELLDKMDPSLVYDMSVIGKPIGGGTSTIVFNTKTQEVEKEFLSLAGTVRNCAGGPTPWNSWITCEETTALAGEIAAVDHGYNFEVPAEVTGILHQPVALVDMGRFNHEAVAVDPKSGIIYQTEDEHDGLIYRFIPNVPGKLVEGGRLQALVIKGLPSLDTRNWEEQLVTVGSTFEVEWIDLEDVTNPNNDLRIRGFEKGAARFARGEGMWYGNDCVYFACTNGGSNKTGQIWTYVPSPYEGTSQESQAPGKVALFLEPNNSDLLQNADNLTVAPWGDIIICEDASKDASLVGVTPSGEIYEFGRNVSSKSELAGVCFSPDGSTLFVNMQVDGLTLAITGPWNG
jgi:uncharacterized protein